MGSWNYQQEIGSEAEDNIIREVFPELLEGAELGESEQESVQGERGLYGRSPQRGYGGFRGGSSSYRRNIRRPALSARNSRRNAPDRSGNGWNMSNARSGYYGWNRPDGGFAWSQSPLGQWGSPQFGGINPGISRALRIFQSRRGLPVTGALDSNTLQTLLNALNQQAAPLPQDTTAPPDPGTSPNDAVPPDSTPAQDASEGVLGEVGTTDATKSWYYIDAYNVAGGTPQQLKSYGPWQDTAAGAARVYDGMCGQYQSSDPATVLVRCYVWFPTSQKWVPCRNSVGFPGTMFCGRLDRS